MPELRSPFSRPSTRLLVLSSGFVSVISWTRMSNTERFCMFATRSLLEMVEEEDGLSCKVL